jgi:N-methylhydantoinase B
MDSANYQFKRKAVDPVTFQVIYHRLISITEEQAATLSAISGSPLVNEATDYNTGIFRANGEIVAMGKTVLFHAASLAEMIKFTIADCEMDPGIRHGDMFMVNHPYKGSLHAPDFGLMAPVIHDGKRLGWIGVCCHQLDVGGMAPGGSFPEATDVLQEGMLVPPVKIVENGEFRGDILRMIVGMSRLPTHMGLDFRGMLAANNVALKRLQETLDHYGVDNVLSVMDEAIDMSERAIRERLKKLPDGIYRSQTFLDHDGQQNKLYRVHVELRKAGDRLIVDMTKSADQTPRFMNCTESGTLAGVRAAMLPILAYDVPWNEGVFRPMELITRPGSIVSAKFPAPVSQGPLGAMWLVENVVTCALSRLFAADKTFMREAQAMPNGGPDFMGMFGRNQYGEDFHGAILDMIYVGGGAYSHRDGLSPQGHRHIPALRLQNVEANEQVAPLLYLYRKLLRDSGGPGRNRGGNSAGVGYILHDVERMALRMACHCYESPTSTGLFGGYPSACNRRRFLHNSNVRETIAQGRMPADTSTLKGELLSFPAKMTRPIEFTAADVYEAGPSAGAGWGDPLEREPQRICEDVRFDAVSVEAASDIYGVVLKLNGELDEAATLARRAGIRRQRLSWPVEKILQEQPQGNPEPLALVGDTAAYVSIGGKAFYSCGCGHVLAPAHENWKHYAGRATTTAAELGPRIALHAELEAVRYACPNCARLLDVEIKLKGEEPLYDFELNR